MNKMDWDKMITATAAIAIIASVVKTVKDIKDFNPKLCSPYMDEFGPTAAKRK